jgi:hypothetical protein
MESASVVPDGYGVLGPPESHLQIVVLREQFVAVLHDEAGKGNQE